MKTAQWHGWARGRLRRRSFRRSVRCGERQLGNLSPPAPLQPSLPSVSAVAAPRTCVWWRCQFRLSQIPRYRGSVQRWRLGCSSRTAPCRRCPLVCQSLYSCAAACRSGSERFSPRPPLPSPPACQPAVSCQTCHGCAHPFAQNHRPGSPCGALLRHAVPQDVVLRVTSTCICGSDLHLVRLLLTS